MNCKPGDLAFIVRSDFPENLGCIVRVLSAFGEFDNYTDKNVSRFTWTVETEGRPLRVMNVVSREIRFAGKCITPDSCLRPIRPEPELLPAPPVAVTA